MRTTKVISTLVLAAALAGCTSMTGQSAKKNIDDAAITSSVKTKLGTEKASTLTSVDVDTVNGVVYLTGTVADAETKRKASVLASETAGVRQVINNLQTRTAGDAPRQ